MTWRAPDLRGRVAVVTGASRGVGRGIALALGDCGATVYVTGRSTRARARSRRPGTVEDAAEAVTARGGRGIAATDRPHRRRPRSTRCSPASPRSRTAASTSSSPTRGAATRATRRGLHRPVLGAADGALGRDVHRRPARAVRDRPRRRAGAWWRAARALIVVTGGTDLGDHYLGNVPYDVVKAASTRLVVALAHELRPHGVAAVGVYPGFTRTEAVVDAFAQQGAEPPPETHSPEFVGRAVASRPRRPRPDAPQRHRRAGRRPTRRRYGFADVDGRTIAPFALPDESPALVAALAVRVHAAIHSLPGVSLSPCATIEQARRARRCRRSARRRARPSRGRAARTSSSPRPWARTTP